MATKVLDIDLERIPEDVEGLGQYSRAMILIRLGGQPLGTVLLPICGERINGNEILEAVIGNFGWGLWNRCLENPAGNGPTEAIQGGLPTATVAVCTRDRPLDLRRCLDGLMRMPDDNQEILVIDNCPSTEATKKLVRQYGCIRYVREEIPGLNRARNRAFQEARNEIVAFIDDDAVPDPGWLRGLLRNFDNPSVLCATGLIMPLELETGAQEFFERHCSFIRGFERRVFNGTVHDPLRAGRTGAGANMAFRKMVLEVVGRFDEALDAGTVTQSGGDTEMFYRILARGYSIVYDPRALNWHRHRRTWPELRKTLYGYASGSYAYFTRCLLIEGELGVFRAAWRWFYPSQFQDLYRALLRRRNRKPFTIVIFELLGCLTGPFNFILSVRGLRKRLKNID